MNTLLKRPIAKSAAALSAAMICLTASPAAANTNANTSADITKPALESQSETLTNGDPRFRELFASWSTVETANPAQPDEPVNIVEQPAVSVPSLMPVNGARISSKYGMRIHPVLGRRKMHRGIDLAAPTGTPVYATADGIVGRADWFSSYGLYISIDHGADLETRYAHLSRLAVAAGERVEKGELIGYVGSTGRSTGPHLHYEVRVDGVAVNPVPYMMARVQESRVADTGESMIPGRRRVGTGGR